MVSPAYNTVTKGGGDTPTSDVFDLSRQSHPTASSPSWDDRRTWSPAAHVLPLFSKVLTPIYLEGNQPRPTVPHSQTPWLPIRGVVVHLWERFQIPIFMCRGCRPYGPPDRWPLPLQLSNTKCPRHVTGICPGGHLRVATLSLTVYNPLQGGLEDPHSDHLPHLPSPVSPPPRHPAWTTFTLTHAPYPPFREIVYLNNSLTRGFLPHPGSP